MRNLTLSALNSSVEYDAIRLMLAGQSNSWTATEGTTPVYLQGAMSNVDGEGHNVYIRTKLNSSYEIAQYNVNNDAQTDRTGQELILGYLICNHYNKDVYIDKVAQGGRPLDEWTDGDADEDLNPTYPYWDWSTNSTGEFFDLLSDNIQEGNTYFDTNNIKVLDLGMFWCQGERDSRAVEPSRSAAYKANLSELEQGLRALTYNPSTWRFVTVVLNDNLSFPANDYLYKDVVRQAQVDFANENVRCYSFDLTPYPMSSDSVHYPVDSHIDFSTDIFNAYFKF